MPTNRRPKFLPSQACLLALLALAACGDVKEDLGMGRSVPDEFAVVDRPPLSMPPDFGMRPPQPGAPRPQEVDMTQRASDTLFNGNTDKPETVTTPAASSSEGETALLNAAGADKATPNIRDVMNREAAQKVNVSDHLLNDLLWWKKDQAPGMMVDAPAEAARIKEVKDSGQPINSGATPTIEQDKSGFLGL